MATWKKISVSGSNVSQFNNDAGYLTTATDLNAFATASINGVDLLAGQQGQINFVTASGEGITAVGTPGTDTVTLGLDSIPNTSLANSTISGKELGTDLDNLTVDDATLNLNTGTTYNGSAARIISVKDGGIDTDAIADSLGTLGSNSFTGSFSGSYFGDGSGLSGVSGEFPTVALEGTSLDTLKFFTNDGASKFISGSQIQDYITNDGSFSGSFSGSFEGDGSGLTGLASTLTVDGDTGTQDVDLLADDLQILGTSNEIETAVTKVANDVKVTIGLPDDVTIGQDLTVSRDVLVNRNLTVLGTASFASREDFEVKDKFILLNSGSTTAGDGGIVIQQNTATNGEVFGFDASTVRFGLTGSFDASQDVFTPDAFMAAVVEGADADPDNAPARYDKKGNIFVGNDENIWIYS